MTHYFTYLYKYRDFFDGLIDCNLAMLFLEKLNEYIISKWGTSYDTYTLISFSGALFNLFYLWATRNYAEDINFLSNKFEQIFSNYSAVFSNKKSDENMKS